jgi:hypothetical protein
MTDEDMADLLSRQIVDDLYRNGLKGLYKYQNVIENTILTWTRKLKENPGEVPRTWGKE